MPPMHLYTLKLKSSVPLARQSKRHNITIFGHLKEQSRVYELHSYIYILYITFFPQHTMGKFSKPTYV